MSVIAKKYDMTGPRGVDKGRKFSRSFALTDTNGAPIDLTGKTVQAQARAGEAKTSPKIIDFVATHNDDGGVITIAYDDRAGAIKADSGYYDIVIIEADGTPDTYVFGAIDFPGRPTGVV